MIAARFLGVLAFLLLLEYGWSEYNLTVVHISDFHSHWFEFNEREGKCTDEESKAGKCFGGFPRLLNLVRDIRKKEKNVIVLSTGEFFLGRSLNPLHGWKIANALLPKLDLDAMSLSNHDFSNGIFELSTFLYGLKFPILCANMLARETSFLYSRVNKSTVLDINGEKIGIVGYIHPETLEKSRKAVSVKFLPEIPAIQKEVERLENYGINKIIALGHSGYFTDLDIAKKVKGVDIVIGGNSDIVLEEPYNDEVRVQTEGNIHGNYPRVHQPEDSNATEAELANRTLVLHIPPHGKYVGVIRVTFDEHGRVISEEGKPVLLDSSIPQDVETLDYLKNAYSILDEVTRNPRLPDDNEILAKAEFEFESRKCRMQECSLGNLVTDAMLQAYQDNKHIKNSSKYPEKWGHVDAVVFNAGSIRYPLQAGNITVKDLTHSLFLGDFMSIVPMNGKQMVEMMEHSVEKYDPTGVTAPGSFLQISGIRVIYDLLNSPGNRVRRLVMRCENCSYPYKDVDPRRTYYVAMPHFISRGGDGYPKLQAAGPKDTGQPEILLIIQYLRKMKVIKPVWDGRISFLNELYPKNYATFTKPHISSISSTTPTKKLDSSVLVASTQAPEKKTVAISTIEKSEGEEIERNPAEKQIIKRNESTFGSQLEKMNPPTFTNPHISSISSTAPTKKLDSSSLVTSTQAPEKKTVPISTIEKSEGEEIEHNPTEKQISKRNESTFGSQLEKMNPTSDTADLQQDKRNSSSMGTTPVTQTNNSTTLVAPQTLTKSIQPKYNHTNMYHVPMEKSYSYVSLMLGRDLEYSTDHTSVERFLKSDNKSVLKADSSNQSLQRITTETKPGIENSASLKDDQVPLTSNLSPPVKSKTEENTKESILAQNNASASLTRNVLDPSTHITAGNSSTEKKWYGNDAVNTLNNSSLSFTLWINNTDLENEFASQDLIENLVISEGEVFDVALKEETMDEEINYQELSSVSINSSEETSNAKNYSKLEEVKQMYKSLIENSTLSETQKALIYAGLAQVNENTVMFDDDDLERISNSLNSYLQDKIAVTAVTSEDGEAASLFKDHFDHSNSTRPLSPSKEPKTEASPVTQTEFTEALTKETFRAPTEDGNNKQQESSRVLNGSISNATSYLKLSNLHQNPDLIQKQADEIKDLLVSSVVNSFVDTMKTKIDQKTMNVNSVDIDNDSEGILKKRVVKKQLKPQSENPILTTAGKFETDSTVSTSTHDSKVNAETHEQNTQVPPGKKVTRSKLSADVENQQKDSVMKSNSQDKTKEDNHKAEIDYVPWKLV